MLTALTALCGALALAAGPHIRGDYVEARTADVYTGPCFSNSEVFIGGDHAVVAWKISEGVYQGQNLAGLSVAAAIEANTTLSKDRPEAARSVVILDEKATPAQRKALLALAKELAGRRLDNVVEVRTAPILLTVENGVEHDTIAPTAHAGAPHAPRAAFWVSGLAEISTRPLDVDDHFCGNEVVEYAPLSKGVNALPAYTLKHHFKGKALGTTWSGPNCRSAFVGQFAL
jgi:hypothetical protein